VEKETLKIEQKENSQPQRDKLGRLMPGHTSPGPGRPPGTRNHVPGVVNYVFGIHGKTFLRRLWSVANQELADKHAGKDVVFQAVPIVGNIIIKRLPSLKTINIDEHKKLTLIQALIKLEGKDAISFLQDGEFALTDGEEEEEVQISAPQQVDATENM